MTREEAKQLLPVITAWAGGCDVQVQTKPGLWHSTSTPGFSPKFAWRIKPEPKLRPWKPEEVPVGGLIRIKSRTLRRGVITAYHESTDEISSASFRTEHPLFGTYGISRGVALTECEHSVDGGKTWLPCGVMENT